MRSGLLRPAVRPPPQQGDLPGVVDEFTDEHVDPLDLVNSMRTIKSD